MSASVKIMLSYDYCHFEVAKHTDENLSDKQINELRKDCQRLADEAVRQYQVGKQRAKEIERIKWQKEEMERRVESISNIPENERSPEQKALLKQSKDSDFYSQFYYDDYDYEDDDETYSFNDFLREG